MSKNLKNFIYDDLTLSSNDIKKTIEAFSAYLDEFDKEYKYNYKFLVSHVEDFEKSIKVHTLFKKECVSIIEELIKDKSINEEFSKILLYKDRMRCNITFNNVLNYSIKDVAVNEASWDINGTLEYHTWERTIENKCADINIAIEFRYDSEHFLKRFYNVNAIKNEHVALVKDFFNESYRAIVVNKLGNDTFQKLKILRNTLPAEFEMSVVVDDVHSLIISSGYLDNSFDYNLLRIERNTNKTPGTFFITLRNQKYKFVKSKLKNIEEVKEEIMKIIQDMGDENEQE